MDERLRFVARRLEGEKMAVLCREFEISRKTGYRIYGRYRDMWARGPDRSQPAALPAGQPAARRRSRRVIVQLKREHPELGRTEDPREAAAPDLGVANARPSAPCTPCSTATDWSRRRRRRRHMAQGTSLVAAEPARTSCGAPTSRASSCSADRRYCYPLTITDFASRYLLTLRGARQHAARAPPSACSSGPSRTLACPVPSAPTTACPSPGSRACSA